jgi:hypothetical protein
MLASLLSLRVAMESKPQPDLKKPDFTRREGKPESICMHCFMTVRAGDLKTLPKREQEHLSIARYAPDFKLTHYL